jgi:tetratricopeptide (TPR) repeat protein
VNIWLRYAVRLAALGVIAVVSGSPSTVVNIQSRDNREAAYRANNKGVAFLEQFTHQPAVAAFREALALDASLRLARINLPIALFYAGQLDAARSEALAARDKYPDAPQPFYLLGLMARSENRVDEAAAAFRRVLALDPDDVGAKVNLAQIDIQQRRYAEAATLCESAVATEPYNATAAYNLAVALTRAGERERGQQAMQRFQDLRSSAYAVTYSQLYLEQGRYAEAVASTGAEAELASGDRPAVMFVDATADIIVGTAAPRPAPTTTTGPLAPGVTLADLDADGDLDAIAAGPSVRVLRGEGGRFTDAAGAIGLADLGESTGIIAGDLNNDTRVDLLVLGGAGPRVFLQTERKTFADATAGAGLSKAPALSRAAALADIDHDGDLDLVIGGLAARLSSPVWTAIADGPPSSSVVFRNRGDATFDEVTAATGLGGVEAVVGIAPTDFDNRRDIDLLLLSYGRRPRLFRNLRDGSFADVAPAVGLPDRDSYTTVAAADLNKDGFTDLFLGRESAPGLFALSDGRGRFRVQPAPPASQGATMAHVVDYDNDGLLDVLVIARDGAHVFRNTQGEWRDETDRTVAAGARESARAGGGIVALASGDIDRDGDTDVLVKLASGALRVWRNDGGNRLKSLRLTLRGRVSNRAGVGAKVEIRAGSLHQKIETALTVPSSAPADLVIGIGARDGADVVRVLWPAGILQAETSLAAASTPSGVTLQELDRKPSSCPYLFTWNGDRFEFVTDFLGGAEMGYWLMPGVRNVPDPDEYVRITGDQLRERGGRFELRVTNELEEALFLDRLQLVAITHPPDVVVHPAEGMRASPRAFELYATRHAQPPLAAVDEHGHDVRTRIVSVDRRYVDDFVIEQIRGYAQEHAITLTLPPHAGPSSSRMLLLTGWTDYAFSSDNVAAHQAGLRLVAPALQVEDGRGGWRTINADIGVPVGRPQTIALDLPADTPNRIRIATTMRIYWDRILIGTSARDTHLRVERVPPVTADLRWRGFSRQSTPDGKEPYQFDYHHVEPSAPWKLMAGRYTREGDVRELVNESDDRMVIARPGDDLSVAFDASALRPMPAGHRRTFLLYSVGYSKEMDLNSASPDAVLPIPFRAMTHYPYASLDQYPHPADLERFHTRVVPRSVPSLHYVERTIAPAKP